MTLSAKLKRNISKPISRSAMMTWSSKIPLNYHYHCIIGIMTFYEYDIVELVEL